MYGPWATLWNSGQSKGERWGVHSCLGGYFQEKGRAEEEKERKDRKSIYVAPLHSV